MVKRKAKTSIDKKQTRRIKDLENFVFKTIENKQLNFKDTNNALTTTWFEAGQFMAGSIGAEDGSDYGDPARIGNSVTLMAQRFNINLQKSTTDEYNQMRIIIAESVDGAQPLDIRDILRYHDYSIDGNLVFSSPYTTKTNANRNYRIKMDKCFNLTPTKPTANIERVLKYGKTGKVVDYPGVGVSFPTNHCVNVFMVSDSTAVAHPFMDYAVRSTYKDA